MQIRARAQGETVDRFEHAEDIADVLQVSLIYAARHETASEAEIKESTAAKIACKRPCRAVIGFRKSRAWCRQ
jgi:hypothetical protein